MNLRYIQTLAFIERSIALLICVNLFTEVQHGLIAALSAMTT